MRVTIPFLNFNTSEDDFGSKCTEIGNTTSWKVKMIETSNLYCVNIICDLLSPMSKAYPTFSRGPTLPKKNNLNLLIRNKNLCHENTQLPTIPLMRYSAIWHLLSCHIINKVNKILLDTQNIMYRYQLDHCFFFCLLF